MYICKSGCACSYPNGNGLHEFQCVWEGKECCKECENDSVTEVTPWYCTNQACQCHRSAIAQIACLNCDAGERAENSQYCAECEDEYFDQQVQELQNQIMF